MQVLVDETIATGMTQAAQLVRILDGLKADFSKLRAELLCMFLQRFQWEGNDFDSSLAATMSCWEEGLEISHRSSVKLVDVERVIELLDTWPQLSCELMWSFLQDFARSGDVDGAMCYAACEWDAPLQLHLALGA